MGRPPPRLRRRDRCRAAATAHQVGIAAVARRQGYGDKTAAARWRRGNARGLLVSGAVGAVVGGRVGGFPAAAAAGLVL